MAKAEKERLTLTLTSHLNTIHETLQVLDQTPPATMEKVKWEDVVKMGEQVSKQATIVGMLWTGGDAPKAKELEENMSSYFNVLQGFLLYFYGSMVGAGPTLSSSLHQSMMQVVNSSFNLMKDTISSYRSRNKDREVSVPVLVGKVWEACSNLKKAPPTNIAAIGRAMTQVAVSIKDVLREMKELKPGSGEGEDNQQSHSSVSGDGDEEDDNDDVNDVGDIGNDLSPEEMKVAESAIDVVSNMLLVIKELIRAITGLLKVEKSDTSGTFVDSLEKLLKSSQEIGSEIDELGACLYPPQEVPAMEATLKKISGSLHAIESEVEDLKGSSDAFVQACSNLRGSIKKLESVLSCCSAGDLEKQLENTSLSN